MRRRGGALILLLVSAVSIVSCGDNTTQPTPRVEPPPPNTPPTIRSVTASAVRTEVDRPVEFVAVVEDQETAADKLAYEWTVNGMAFSGVGPKVTWSAARGSATPTTYSIKVTVTEKYSALGPNGQIVTNEHRVASEPVPLRIHDSPQEIRDMGLRFLESFADSAISPQTCVIEFSDKCAGKRDELEDIEFNREHYKILDSSVMFQSVNVSPNAVDAQVYFACSFTSQITKCESQAEWPGCKVGAIEHAKGTCFVTAVYEQSRWWLCESRFLSANALPPSMLRFFDRAGTP
jgi:hypothetical protein